MDAALLERPGKEIQLDLFLNYASNVKLYPKFQEYLRKSKPPLLAIWGRNDPFFIPAGAEAFRKDLPSAKVEFLDTGTSRWRHTPSMLLPPLMSAIPGITDGQKNAAPLRSPGDAS